MTILAETMRLPLLLMAMLALPAAANDELPAAKPRPDAMQTFTVNEARDGVEPPLTENEPVYFGVGTRGGGSARFQLSFKYRLFDRTLGWGREAPWLAGFYFGYTQTSLWDLSGNSKPFRDTSYRPSLFWSWERTDDKTWINALRGGLEHESNGKDGAQSRSINTLFVRPAWRHDFENGKRLEFAPKLYGYLDKADNPDIQRYRGYVDWQLRYGDDVRSWRAMARIGTADKGSLTLDWFERTRVLGFGPVSGYFHVQFFTGYGEDLLDYNVRRKSQLRLGLAIVP
jgi:phospholipase A1/A2